MRTEERKTAEASRSHMPRWVRAAVLVLALVAFAAGGIRLIRPVWKHHSGEVRSDGFTYCSFARQLSLGRFFCDDPIAQLVAESHDRRVVAEGPVWNTGIRSDGRMVYTVSIGYPAFLAALYKVGGAWLMVHANLFLLLAALACFFLLVWEAAGRGVEGVLMAVAAILLLPRLDPHTFNQFTYPWREPLSYAFVLGAAWATLLFRRSGQAGWLPLLGLFLGLACSVKEANFIYGPWLALFVLMTPGAARNRTFWIGAGAGVVGLVVGLSPLLAQNYLCTGNPLLPLQVVRETKNFSATEAGAGLSLGNALNTICDYWHMYREMPWSIWGGWAAAVGVVATCRAPGGLLFLGLLVSHLLLYFQWGNADYRHLFFALIPVAFLMVAGVAGVTRVAARMARGYAPWVRTAMGVGLVVWVASLPRPWHGVLLPLAEVVPGEEIGALVAEVEAVTPTNALILVNRALRDQWAAYGTRPFAQLHELRGLAGGTGVVEAVSAMHKHGIETFFLDATDQTPNHHRRIDWSVVDREWLLNRFDLNPVWSADAETKVVRYFTHKPALTLYDVRPWSNAVMTVSLRLTEPDPPFLVVDPREAGTDLVVRVNGHALPQPATDAYLRLNGPYSDPFLAVAVTRRSGQPVPSEPVVRLIGWTESVWQATCDYASPPDSAVFPDGLPAQAPDTAYRVLSGATRIRVPCRSRADLFPVARLATQRIEGELPCRVRMDSAQGRLLDVDLHRPWIPIPAGPTRTAKLFDFTLMDVPSGGLRLYGIGMQTAWRRMAIHPASNTVLVAVMGDWVNDPFEGTNGSWTATLNGKTVAGGSAFIDPTDAWQGMGFVPSPDGGAEEVAWKGVGVVRPTIAETGPKLAVRLDQPTRAFCEGGLYPVEGEGDSRYVWTKAQFRLRVPLTPGVSAYRLRLRALDGHPHEDREVTIAAGAFSACVRLDDAFRDHVLTVPSPDLAAKMATITFTVAPWSPVKVLGVRDSRDLGFQFCEADWEPDGLVK